MYRRLTLRTDFSLSPLQLCIKFFWLPMEFIRLPCISSEHVAISIDNGINHRFDIAITKCLAHCISGDQSLYFYADPKLSMSRGIPGHGFYIQGIPVRVI